MQLDQSILRFRARHEALFRSTVTVYRPAIEAGSFDSSTGQIAPASPTLIYEGPAQVRESALGGLDATTGEREVREQDATLRLPHDTPIAENDVVTVVTTTHDVDLVGQVYRITDVQHDDWQVVRRAVLENITPVSEESS